MGFRNRLTDLIDPVARAAAAAASEAAAAAVERLTGPMGGDSIELAVRTGAGVAVIEAGGDGAGDVLALHSPVNLAGLRSSLVLRGVDVGNEGAWLSTPGAFYVEAAGGMVLLDDPAWQTYAPVWTTSGLAPVLGNGSLSGRWRQLGRTVDLALALTFGSTTNAGSGSFAFSLPIPAIGREQFGDAKAFTTDQKLWAGLAYIPPAGHIVQALMTRAATDSSLGFAQSANASAPAAGQGIPLVPGNWPFLGGTNLFMTIRYESAAA